jgi:hypothetical protein
MPRFQGFKVSKSTPKVSEFQGFKVKSEAVTSVEALKP